MLVVVELVLVGIDCRRRCRWIRSFGAALDLFFASRFFLSSLEKMRMHGVRKFVRCVGWFARIHRRSMAITFNAYFVALNRHRILT